MLYASANIVKRFGVSEKVGFIGSDSYTCCLILADSTLVSYVNSNIKQSSCDTHKFLHLRTVVVNISKV